MLTLIKHTAAKATFTLTAAILLIGCGSSNQSPLGPQTKPAVANPQLVEDLTGADIDESYQNQIASGQELFEEGEEANDPSSDPYVRSVEWPRPIGVDTQQEELEPYEDREEEEF